MATDVKDLRGLTSEELAQKVRDLKKELFHLRVQNATGRVESPARFKAVRREVARVKTIARELGRTGAK
ncbi:MAG: 50S ribosomal protein L29 [Nitrospirota bacterium]